MQRKVHKFLTLALDNLIEQVIRTSSLDIIKMYKIDYNTKIYDNRYSNTNICSSSSDYNDSENIASAEFVQYYKVMLILQIK